MKQVVKTIVVLPFLLALGLISNAAGSTDSNNNLLFKISRSKDANEIYYEVKTKSDGLLDFKEPIKIYWIKHAKNSAIETLTAIQQNFAYGLKFLEVSPEKAQFQFVSYTKRTLTLRKDDSGSYVVFLEVDGKEVELKRLFIQIDGGTFWFPKISLIEVHAKKGEVGEMVVEVIRP